MKKFCIGFILVAILTIAFFMGVKKEPSVKTEYLRIHVRANSNTEEDQAVKYAVKDAVVDFLTPLLVKINSKDDAITCLKQNIVSVKSVAEEVLKDYGFFYGANVKIVEEEFPTRWYDGYCLEAGVYDAVVIELGDGLGDNWWCVVYPPLCFVSSETNYVYKSKLLDVISDFFNR